MGANPTYSGWKQDRDNDRLDIYYKGTRLGHISATGLSLAGSQMTDSVLQAAGLSTNLKTGFIPLDITSLREITSNDIGNVADGAAWGSGGILAQDSTPKLERINDATDKGLRVHWAATVVDEVQFPPIPIPPDFDNSRNMTVHLLVYKGTNTDTTFVIDVQAWSGIGDTEMGGNTAAITETSAAEKTVTLTGANVGTHPGVVNIGLVPAAHANDAIYLLAAWIEYTRKA